MSLLSGPFGLLVKLGLLAAFVGGVYAMGYTNGKKRATDACAAEKLVELQKYQAAYQKATDRANVLSQKLATRETEIVYRTKEVIKYVPQVTSNRPCLSSAAVRMLNHRPDKPAVPETPSKPVAESPAEPAATDTDVAYWIADANGQYEICAARVNALIDFFAKEK